MDTKPISDGGRSNQSGCLIAFFVLFAIIGAVVTAFMLNSAFQVFSAKNWIPTPCTILSSRVTEHSDSDGTTFGVEINYQYRYKGTTYTSDRYKFMSATSSGRSGKEQTVRKFHPGATGIICYVNPDNPSQAVIERGFTWDMLMILVPLTFVIIGLGGIIFVLRKRRTAGLQPLTTEGAPATRRLTASDLGPARGPKVLKPMQSRLAGFIFLLIFGLIWNGFTWPLLVIPAFSGILKFGGADFCSILFSIPFALAGIGTIVGAVYMGLALLNPRIVVIAEDPVTLGAKLNFSWEFDGQTSRIQKLTITLDAREHATYRRGTDTVTDKETFFTQVVLETLDPIAIAKGRVSVDIPIDTMHSFDAPNNKIVWTLKFHGDIPMWPDIKDEFVITVLPIAPDTLTAMLAAQAQSPS